MYEILIGKLENLCRVLSQNSQVAKCYYLFNFVWKMLASITGIETTAKTTIFYQVGLFCEIPDFETSLLLAKRTDSNILSFVSDHSKLFIIGENGATRRFPI